MNAPRMIGFERFAILIWRDPPFSPWARALPHTFRNERLVRAWIERNGWRRGIFEDTWLPPLQHPGPVASTPASRGRNGGERSAHMRRLHAEHRGV